MDRPPSMWLFSQRRFLALWATHEQRFGGMTEAGFHHSDHRGLRLQGPVGAPQRGRDKVSIAHQMLHSLPDRAKRMASRRMRQRQGFKLVRRKHRLPLFEAIRRAGNELQG